MEPDPTTPIVRPTRPPTLAVEVTADFEDVAIALGPASSQTRRDLIVTDDVMVRVIQGAPGAPARHADVLPWEKPLAEVVVPLYAAIVQEGDIRPMVSDQRCPDCQVAPGQPHEDGCDVARCTECGWQRLGCVHSQMGTMGLGQAWTGRWPGQAEVEMGLARDLNDLAMRAVRQELVWDRREQRWVRREVSGDGTA